MANLRKFKGFYETAVDILLNSIDDTAYRKQDEMPYPANTKHWEVGDLVIHSADAKQPHMLMRVIGYDAKTGEAITVYHNPPTWMSEVSKKAKWRNDISHLLDPRPFGIAV